MGWGDREAAAARPGGGVNSASSRKALRGQSTPTEKPRGDSATYCAALVSQTLAWEEAAHYLVNTMGVLNSNLSENSMKYGHMEHIQQIMSIILTCGIFLPASLYKKVLSFIILWNVSYLRP